MCWGDALQPLNWKPLQGHVLTGKRSPPRATAPRKADATRLPPSPVSPPETPAQDTAQPRQQDSVGTQVGLLGKWPGHWRHSQHKNYPGQELCILKEEPWISICKKNELRQPLRLL